MFVCLSDLASPPSLQHVPRLQHNSRVFLFPLVLLYWTHKHKGPFLPPSTGPNLAFPFPLSCLALFDLLWTSLGLAWPHLAFFGPLWARLDPVWLLLCAPLGPAWPRFAPSFRPFLRSAPFGPSLGKTRGRVQTRRCYEGKEKGGGKAMIGGQGKKKTKKKARFFCSIQDYKRLFVLLP